MGSDSLESLSGTPVETALLAESVEPLTETLPTSVTRRERRRLGFLLLITVGLAILGQYYFATRPEYIWDAIVFYLAAIAVYGLVVSGMEHRPAVAARRPGFAWRAIANRRVLLIAAGLACSWLAEQMATDAVQPPGSGTFWFLWLGAIALVVAGLWPNQAPGPAPWTLIDQGRTVIMAKWKSRMRDIGWPRWELALLTAGTLGAFLVRAVNLTGIPYLLTGDEASMGMEAVRIIRGELGNPFITGWMSHPTLFFFLQSWFIRLFGQNETSIRLLSALVGAATVLVVYLFVREWWGRATALVAAGVLLTYHFHVHYSRLGLNNIWDPLFVVVIIGSLLHGWRTGRRWPYMLAGLTLGFSQYFYMGSRLLPILLVGLAVYWWLTDPAHFRRQLPNLLSTLLLGLVIGLPILLFFARHPDDFMARVNLLGLFQAKGCDGQNPSRVLIDCIAADKGWSHLQVLLDQLLRAALGFTALPDASPWYNPGVPLLLFWPSVLFTLGIGYALFHWRETRYAVLLGWLAMTIVFGGALLENPPSSQRYVIVAPAICIFVAIPLTRVFEWGRRLWPEEPQWTWRAGLALAVGLIMLGDANFYFRLYTPQYRFGDQNTEIAYQGALYLRTLPQGTHCYFLGAPRMYYGGFPTFPYLTAGKVEGQDIDSPLTSVEALKGMVQQGGPAVFLLVPERQSEMEVIRAAYPEGGPPVTHTGHDGNILFISYEVPQAQLGLGPGFPVSEWRGR